MQYPKSQELRQTSSRNLKMEAKDKELSHDTRKCRKKIRA
jgi:hypothetical protein